MTEREKRTVCAVPGAPRPKSKWTRAERGALHACYLCAVRGMGFGEWLARREARTPGYRRRSNVV